MKNPVVARGFAGAGVVGVLVALAAFVLLAAGSYSSDAEAAERGGQSTTVSIDDLNAAVAATTACIDAAGVEVNFFPGEGLRPDAFGWTVPAGADGAPDGASMDAAGECRREHLTDVEMAYGRQTWENPPEALVARLFASIEQCAASGGLPDAPKVQFLPGGTYPGRTLNIAPENHQFYPECANQAYAETGLQPPPFPR